MDSVIVSNQTATFFLLLKKLHTFWSMYSDVMPEENYKVQEANFLRLQSEILAMLQSGIIENLEKEENIL